MDNVLVTGASRGIGLAIASKLAASGYGVTAVARRNSEELNAAIEVCRGRANGSLHFAALDSDRHRGYSRVHPAIAPRPGADLRPRQQCRHRRRGAPRGLCPTARSKLCCAFNNLSPIVLTKYVVRGMMRRGAGASSICPRSSPRPAITRFRSMAASKAAMIGFTKIALARGRAPRRHRQRHCAGFIDTEMTRGLDENATQAHRRAQRAAPPGGSRGCRQYGGVSDRRDGAATSPAP